jgi:hypothetical protein
MSDNPEDTDEADDKLEDRLVLRRPPPDLRRPMPKLNPLMPLTLDIPLSTLELLIWDPTEIPDMMEWTDASSLALVMPLITDPVSGLERGLRRPGRRIPAPDLWWLEDDNRFDVLLRPHRLVRLPPPEDSPNIRLACPNV